MTDQDVDSVGGPVLARHFTEFAATCERRAPLYSSLSRGIARTPELSGLLRFAPPPQRLPVLLFAVIHHLLLDEPSDPLASWYPNLREAPRPPDDELMPAFTAFVDGHLDDVQALLATRSTQTNEVGRSGFLLPALALVEQEVGPLAHVDVGTSGGLNLLLDHFEYRYTNADGAEIGHIGGPSDVLLHVETTGVVPVPSAIPVIAARCGIDRSPIDVADPEAARWLEACVWPDQADRFHRLVAAIELARRNPPEIVAGDAVTSLAPAIERLGASGHPVVTNSWVLNYLTSESRVAYLAELERIGATRDISWIFAEAPALIPELPVEPDPKDPQRTVLSLARWRNGSRTVDHLATCHPHGFWIHWH